tara:strand:- start:876 stop:1061 length:186 start_codon:yes stop_codon:yes gene_type:complete
MYLLHKKDKIVKSENERINSMNRQLMMEYSELQSGVMIYQKAKDELLMFAPSKDELDDVSI